MHRGGIIPPRGAKAKTSQEK